MAGNCGLNSWQQNSEIVHATSTDPEGPYVYNSTLLPHFAHGPKIRKLKDGSYFMMHLGCGYPFKPYVTTCKNGTTKPGLITSADPTNDEPAAAAPPLCNQFNVSIKTAKSLWGPWTDSQQVYLSSGSAPSWYVPSGRAFSNPSPHVMPDGSLTCAFRADARSGGEHVSISLAPTILGPYVDTRPHPAISSHNGEGNHFFVLLFFVSSFLFFSEY
jgi:hypothetical protein